VRPDGEDPPADPMEAAEQEFTTLVRRVHGFSPSALRRRRDELHRWLAEVRELTALAARRSMPALPEIADHAVAAAVAVVGGDLLDVLADGRNDDIALRLARVTRAALDATR
jgi:hypothetical protein